MHLTISIISLFKIKQRNVSYILIEIYIPVAKPTIFPLSLTLISFWAHYRKQHKNFKICFFYDKVLLILASIKFRKYITVVDIDIIWAKTLVLYFEIFKNT